MQAPTDNRRGSVMMVMRIEEVEETGRLMEKLHVLGWKETDDDSSLEWKVSLPHKVACPNAFSKALAYAEAFRDQFRSQVKRPIRFTIKSRYIAY